MLGSCPYKNKLIPIAMSCRMYCICFRRTQVFICAGAAASSAEQSTYKIINFFYMTTKVYMGMGGVRGLQIYYHLNNNNHKSYFGNARAMNACAAKKKKKPSISSSSTFTSV